MLKSRKQGYAEQRFVVCFFNCYGDWPIDIWTCLCQIHGVQTMRQQTEVLV